MAELRGPIVDVGETRSVSTQYGERDLAEVTLRPERGQAEPVTLTLWGKWSETAEYTQTGMEVLALGVEREEFRGEIQYATAGDSRIVIEPDYLVNVTDVRSWVQCPRMHYLNTLSGVPLNYPVVKGTVVHEVFSDLLRGGEVEAAIDDRVAEVGLDLGLLDRDADEVRKDVSDHARAIDGWLSQGTLEGGDEWRSEQTLISERYGLKGRADAVRRGAPVELKTGKNTNSEPRFQDKVQVACYALLLDERGEPPDTGTLLYTKNAALDRNEESGDLSPAKDFSLNEGLLDYVLRERNHLAAMAVAGEIPTGYEANATCNYCFEQDTCMVVSGRLDQESKAGRIGEAIPEEERNYFERFYRAIEAERGAVHDEYAKLWTQTATERADADRALIDLEPVGKKEVDGRWELRARCSDPVSKIREGDVVLASDGHPVRGNAEMARVVSMGEEIVVTADEPVELRRLDVYPSEIGADRMLTALHDALLAGDEDQKDVLIDRRDPVFRDVEETFIDNNPAQDRAVRRAVGADDCALIHGPPGTGKTYTIARTVRALVERGERVLLSAFTNRAVDNALDALRDQGYDEFVRVGTEHGVREDIQEYRLESRGDPDERAAELREASVVAATTASCGSRIMREGSFDVAVIDEASQLTEPATLAAVALADRFVLVGDHQQLPPVVQSADAAGTVETTEHGDDSADDGTTGATTATDGSGVVASGTANGTSRTAGDVADLSRSLFERLIETHPEAAVLLDTQYRMAQRIQAFSSNEFYDGRLRPASPDIAAQHVADLPEVTSDALPDRLQERVSFVDPDGTARGNTNPAEVTAVAEIVEAYAAAGVAREDIGVIAPFRAQAAAIRRELPAVTVDTVDRFQGSAKEVIVVSFVATGDLDSPIFEDFRRVNVALTRAKKALVLVGDRDALATDERYARMVEWAE
ncbi:AAA domain-containing protein [Halococcus saccharolyticus]|uniref:DNA helicase n=1 Tax=Halococcus saccharolyticus DSM 5350 TaxID=1227455 RepID=M0MFH2_9EURY|nr:AAA domain-containing protein [Halococcus saccharolyticus]EMA44472.1 DNA replication factor Dna2 [Halococcus saccharolyticus DSM 5350]